VKDAAHNRFIDIDVAVAYFEVKTAFWISTNPGFVMNIGSLAAKVRKRNELPCFAFLTLGKVNLIHDCHLPAKIKTHSVYMKSF
jgi:hypothetical protein